MSLLEPRQLRAMNTYFAELVLTSISLISCLTVGRAVYFDWNLEVETVTQVQ